jgi:hypothetical protein
MAVCDSAVLGTGFEGVSKVGKVEDVGVGPKGEGMGGVRLLEGGKRRSLSESKGL